MKRVVLFAGIFVFLLVLLFILFNPFRAPSSDKSTQIFSIQDSNNEATSLKLQEGGFIRSLVAFDLALSLKGKKGEEIKTGGYYLSKNMDMWQVIDELYKGPDLKWVTVVPGMRKEQIGEKLKETFDWDEKQLKDWNEVYTAMKIDDIEGVYFPDTYLIPVKEDGLAIANRMIAHFNEKFAPYLEKFAKKDIRWTTGLRIASLIQRESAGTDMKLISGIIWNRLLKNHNLELDASVQYAKGKTDGNWWPPVYPSDININSPYNTYQHVGLPPYPISEPSLQAIDAALNPQETECLYYLHDRLRQIHCAKTYQEHLKNVDTYLNK